MNKDKLEIIFYVLKLLLLGWIISLALAFPTMWLWNYLMPKIFGLPTLTFWQTFGLQVLVSCFFPSGSRGGKN